MLLSTPNAVPKIVLVTSPDKNCGKTFVSSNLSCALGQLDKKVLLIDSDLRNPRLHRVFRYRNRVGLSNILTGQKSLKDGCIMRTEIPNLYLMMSGVPSIYSSARVSISVMIWLLLRSLVATFKTRPSLALENLALQQQLAVQKRSVKRPRLSNLDRGLWVLFRRFWTDSAKVLVIVKHDTVVRWHRAVPASDATGRGGKESATAAGLPIRCPGGHSERSAGLHHYYSSSRCLRNQTENSNRRLGLHVCGAERQGFYCKET
jgi:hypothetical protein